MKDETPSPLAVFGVGFLVAVLLAAVLTLGSLVERVSLARQCTAIGKFTNYNHVFLCVQGPDAQL